MPVDEQDDVVSVRDVQLAMEADGANQLLRGLLEMKGSKPAADRDKRVKRGQLGLDVIEVSGHRTLRRSGLRAWARFGTPGP